MRRKAMRGPNDFSVWQPNCLIGHFRGLKTGSLRFYSAILKHNHQVERNRLEYFIPFADFISTTNQNYLRKKQKTIFKEYVEPWADYTFSLDIKDYSNLFPGKPNRSIKLISASAYNSKGITINLDQSFKYLLTRLDLGFTKGDHYFLKTMKNEAAYHLYWLIRKVQQNRYGKDNLTLPLPELKMHLGLPDKYDRWNNFKARVINPIKNEFSDSWVAFDYSIKSAGRGGKTDKITFHFKHDIELEKSYLYHRKYDFEDVLIYNFGFKPEVVKDIRIRIRQKHYPLNNNPDVFWSQDYVWACIHYMMDLLERKKRKVGCKPIKNVPGYLWSAMQNGIWLEQFQNDCLYRISKESIVTNGHKKLIPAEKFESDVKELGYSVERFLRECPTEYKVVKMSGDKFYTSNG